MNFNSFQELIARVLLLSLFLQSCGGAGFDNNPLISKQEEQVASIQTNAQAILPLTNIQSLLNKQLIAQGGHAVTFYQEAGQLKADVEMNAPQGFSKIYEGLSVSVEQGTDLAQLSSLEAKSQERRISLQLAEGNQPARIVIYKVAGLAGGMQGGEEEANEDDSIPNECFCPITQEIMEDPVIAQDGHTYERAAIKRWLDMGKRTSPKTGARLLSTELTPNHTMRSLIQDVKAQVPVLARHKVDMQNIEVAIKLREEEIAETLTQKGELIEKESQARLNVEEALEEKERELVEKTAALRIMEDKIKELERQVGFFLKKDKAMQTTMLQIQQSIGQLLNQQLTYCSNSTSSSSSSSDNIFIVDNKKGNKLLAVDKRKEKGKEKLKNEDQEEERVITQNREELIEANDCFKLGLRYQNGEGVEKDNRKAFEWFQKAAEQGHATAQNGLGVMYYNGKGTEKNYAKAKRWYEKAAKQGYAEAQYKLGAMYDNGEGVTIDFIEAKKWYEKAACQGVSVAQARLGSLYYYGRGVQINRAEAERLCLQVRERIVIDAQKGNVDCQLSLGWMYSEGCGMRRNYSKAMAWYQKAANQGCAVAQNNLGVMYAYDWFGAIKKDYTKAREWYQKAAEQGYARAQYNLAGLYYNGQGVEKDYAKAVEWYQKAAEQGYAYAQYRLGIMYRNGFGVGKDNIKAIEWFRKAAEKGYEDAQIILNSVVIHFSS